MQITSNTVSAVISFYKKELASVYSESELKNIIRWVLEKQLGITATDIASDPGMRINESDLTPLERMCFELKGNKPIQYVLGEAEFYHLKFKVNENVLIPRPETEELVEKVIGTLIQSPSSLVLDIGTGSGCIPIAIKKNVPDAEVYAVDVSEAAIGVAQHNATVNNVNVTVLKADILKEDAPGLIRAGIGGKQIDVIISNPPYVLLSEKESLHGRVRDFEPHLALFVEDEDPILFYRKIAQAAKELLKSGGSLWFECHAQYAFQVHEMLIHAGYENVKLHSDLSGAPRFTEATMR